MHRNAAAAAAAGGDEVKINKMIGDFIKTKQRIGGVASWRGLPVCASDAMEGGGSEAGASCGGSAADGGAESAHVCGRDAMTTYNNDGRDER